MNSNEEAQSVSDDAKKNRKFGVNAQACEQYPSNKEIIGCLLFLGIVLVLMYIFAPEVIDALKTAINYFK